MRRRIRTRDQLPKASPTPEARAEKIEAAKEREIEVVNPLPMAALPGVTDVASAFQRLGQVLARVNSRDFRRLD